MVVVGWSQGPVPCRIETVDLGKVVDLWDRGGHRTEQVCSQHECLVLWNKVVSLEESHARDNADQTTLIYIMDQRIVEIELYTSLSVSRVSIMLLEVVECSFWQGHQGMGKSHWRRWTQWTNSFWRWTSWRVKRFHLKRNSRCTATP